MDAILNQRPTEIVYERTFGALPDFHYFLASQKTLEKFDALMRMAIERGKPLTQAEVDSAPAPKCGDTMEL